jgi:hypothetical protein
MKTTQTSKIVILFLLIFAFIIISLKVENNIKAAACMGGILLILWLSNVISEIIVNKRRNSIIKKNVKIKAKIVSSKIYSNRTILQLQIILSGESYITSMVNRISKDEIDGIYEVGQIIEVFINPENRYEVIIPEHTKTKKRQFRINWATIITITVSASPIIIPIVIAIFDTSGREFKDLAYVRAGETQESMWELRFEEPSKIYIKIFDPLNKSKTISIKDKKAKELSSNTDFFIARQNQNVVILGTGETPVFDIYDPVTHKKISGIEDFEQKNEVLRKGIAKIESKTIHSKFNKDKVIQIITNNGRGYYYDINQNRFYNSEDEIQKYFKQADLDLLSQHMSILALSPVPNSAVENHQLCTINATSKKGIDDLLSCIGDGNLDLNNFNKAYYYRYKYCKLTTLLKDDYFINGKIIYLDFDLIVIQYLESASAEAEFKIKAFDNTGKTIFKIELKDYPNIEKIKEDYSSNLKSFYCKEVVRDKENLIFLFEKYGAICIDLKTGKLLWKFEP